MKYKSGPRFDYISDSDYGVLPSGEVVFRNEKLPEEIKQRLIKDVQREQEEWLNPSEDESILRFE